MRILIAEDDRVSRKMLEVKLEKWGHELVVAENGMQAWDMLQEENSPRLAILDWMMPELDGVSLCKNLRACDPDRYTYIIILTSRSKPADVVVALDSGADDYLMKPVGAEELRARVAAGERVVKLHQRLEAANKRLALMAETDELTQISNRNAILTHLGFERMRASREHAAMGVVMVDVDKFKRVNDTQGHAVGDIILKDVANRLVIHCRPYDCVGRYGGEEFVVGLFSNPTPEDVQCVCERLRNSIEEEPICGLGVCLNITASFGAVWVHPECDEDVFAILRTADALMYQAKNAGRNRVEFGRTDSTEFQPATRPSNR